MIASMDELLKVGHPLSSKAVDTCRGICSLLEICVEKGNLKTYNYLVRQVLFDSLRIKVNILPFHYYNMYCYRLVKILE